MISRVMILGLILCVALLPLLHCLCSGVELLSLSTSLASGSASIFASLQLSQFFFDFSGKQLPHGIIPMLNVSGASLMLFWWMLARSSELTNIQQQQSI